MEMLRMENITKIYPNGFIANQAVTFSVEEGEIHALVGENGAGKTTLMKILFGMEPMQEGKIYIHGKETPINSPMSAIEQGVGMVHQHFMLLPSLTVAENMILGAEPLKKGLLDYKKAVQMSQTVADKYGFKIDVTSKVEKLSVGMMQKVEILKVLMRGAKLLILDEPTAVLTPQETTELFEQLRILCSHGHSIIFISHKLDEVISLCSRVTILRHGQCKGTFQISEIDAQSISQKMVGRDVVLAFEKPAACPGPAALEVKNISCFSEAGKKLLDELSFTVHKGEIVGIAGVEGNGQSELSGIISGMNHRYQGEVCINGFSIRGRSIKNIRASGFSFVPEDRMSEGVAADMAVWENLIADRLSTKDFVKSGFILNNKKIESFTSDVIREFEISCDEKSEPVRMLSGGNIQKVVVAREFTTNAGFILVNQPTRGVDIGTAEMIRRTLIRLSRDQKTAVLLISADLNELLEVSDRLLVMRSGKIVAAFPKAGSVSEASLGEYMLGLRKMKNEEMVGIL